MNDSECCTHGGYDANTTRLGHITVHPLPLRAVWGTLTLNHFFVGQTFAVESGHIDVRTKSLLILIFQTLDLARISGVAETVFRPPACPVQSRVEGVGARSMAPRSVCCVQTMCVCCCFPVLILELSLMV